MVSALHEKLYVDDDVRFTIGMITLEPNVPSVIASRALFSIDIRHPDSVLLEQLASDVNNICKDQVISCDVKAWRIAEAESINFPSKIINLVESISNKLGIPNTRIFSGAGHDARQLHFVCPTYIKMVVASTLARPTNKFGRVF